MTNIVEVILGLTVFSVILSGLADTVLSATWAKSYFTSGLVVFSRCVSVELHHSNIPSSPLLNNKVNSFRMGGLIFRELDENKYGFRRKFFTFAPRTMMHGSLGFDSENNLVIVKGYADWVVIALSVMFIIIFPLLWFIGGPRTKDVFLQLSCFVLFYSFITGISFLIDYYRLRTITRIASELWSRKYVKSP
jgi:hypothetical protein